MSLLRAKATKVFFSDNGTLTEYTEECRRIDSPAMEVSWVGAQDALYLGGAHKFNHRYFAFETAGSVSSQMTVSYWNGTAWAAFTDLVDETAGCTASGFVSWEERKEWQKAKAANVTGLTAQTFEEERYWLKITLAGNPGAFSLRAILMLLSDDRLLTTLYPECMSYLPTGESPLKWHLAAKDAIVNYLVVKGLISYPDQIKNPEDWLLAASYKWVELVLAPIAGDERLAQVKKEFADNALMHMRMAAASLDQDKDEELDETENEPGNGGSKWLSR